MFGALRHLLIHQLNSTLIVTDIMLERNLRAKGKISFNLEKVVHVTLVQSVMLLPQLTITCEMISHIAQPGTEHRESKAIHIQSRTGP